MPISFEDFAGLLSPYIPVSIPSEQLGLAARPYNNLEYISTQPLLPGPFYLLTLSCTNYQPRAEYPDSTLLRGCRSSSFLFSSTLTILTPCRETPEPPQLQFLATPYQIQMAESSWPHLHHRLALGSPLPSCASLFPAAERLLKTTLESKSHLCHLPNTLCGATLRVILICDCFSFHPPLL